MVLVDGLSLAASLLPPPHGCSPNPRCWDTLPATGRERDHLSRAGIACSVLLFVPQTGHWIGLSMGMSIGMSMGGRTMRQTSRRDGSVLDLYASK